MSTATKVELELSELVAKHTAFDNLLELVKACNTGYVPTIHCERFPGERHTVRIIEEYEEKARIVQALNALGLKAWGRGVKK